MPSPSKSTKQTAIHPRHILRAFATDLEAVLTLLHDSPEPHPVHRLRTATRRIEAQLTLLSLLPGLPEHAAPTRKLNRLLRKLRKAAGFVRDLDVQRDLLKTFAATTPEAKIAALTTPAADLPAPESSAQKHPGRKSPDTRIEDQLQAPAKYLRKLLRHRRTAAAADLVHLLQRRGPKLATHLESLISTLGPADPALTPAEFQQLVEGWFDRSLRRLLGSPAEPVHRSADVTPTVVTPAHITPADLTTDQLHGIRKLAKAARYLGESAAPPVAPGIPAARSPLSGMAKRFESLQDAGGTWHDALTLARLARRELGRHDPLALDLAAGRDQALANYQQQLATFLA